MQQRTGSLTDVLNRLNTSEKPGTQAEDECESERGTTLKTTEAAAATLPTSRTDVAPPASPQLAKGRTKVWLKGVKRKARVVKLICMRIGHTMAFRTITSCVVLLYVVYLGIQANAVAEFKRGRRDSLQAYQQADSVFICVFVVELVIRSVGYVPMLGDRILLRLEIMTISVQALENFILTPLSILDPNSQEGQWTMVLGLCRTARIASVINLLRRFRWLEPLYLLISGVRKTFTCFVFVCFMLASIIMTTSLVFLSFVGTEDLPPTLKHHFQSFGWTSLTFLEVALKGLEWSTEVTRPFFEECSTTRCLVAGYAFVGWVVVIHLCILCIVTGLFIECMDTALTQNRARKVSEQIVTSQRAMELLEQTFKVGKKFGRDHNTKMSLKEINEAISANSKLVQQVGLNWETAEALFRQLSANGVEGKVTMSDFMFGCLSMTRNTQTIDMLVIDYQQQKAVEDLRLLGKWCSEDVDSLIRSLDICDQRCKALRNKFTEVQYTIKHRVQSLPDTESGLKTCTADMFFVGKGSGASRMGHKKSRRMNMNASLLSSASGNEQPAPDPTLESPVLQRRRQARTAAQAAWLDALDEARPHFKRELAAAVHVQPT